jgi:oxygen-dependent protoporphyrinogen oxidase
VVAVVGGGIAGLAAAWALTDVAEPPHVVLLEASGRVGGKLEVSGLDGINVDVGAGCTRCRLAP